MLDLSTPALRQADILQAIPGLKEKSLQNWYHRKILRNSEEAIRTGLVDNEKPGRQAKRLANAFGFLVIATMYEMGRLGIEPADAREIGFALIERADDMNKAGMLDRLEVAIDHFAAFEVWLLTPAQVIQVDGEEPAQQPGRAIGDKYRLVQRLSAGAVERFATGRAKIEIEFDAIIKHYLAAALKTPAGPIISPEVTG